MTTYIDAGEEYDVILEGERALQRTPTDLQNIYVRSSRSGALIPLSNLVTLEEFADSKTLDRYNRVRAINGQQWKEDRGLNRNIQLWGKLKAMGWMVKSTVSAPPCNFRLTEAINHEIIGEAVKRLSNELTSQSPHIPFVGLHMISKRIPAIVFRAFNQSCPQQASVNIR